MSHLKGKIKPWLTVFSLLTLLLSAVPVSAERIIANSRVISHVNVREQPSVDSAVVGILRTNESAELIERVPYWYQVELKNGVTGFVSKAWTQKLTEAEEVGEVVRLGSWNIRKLGHGVSKNYNLLAQAIEDNFDVLVVVEVMQKQGGHPGYDALLSGLGEDWAGLITDTPRPNTSSGNAEYYAILYRTALVQPCAGWDKLIYHEDNDGSGHDTGPDIFSREPAYSCLEAPLNDSSIGIDFLIAAYHARWASGNTTKISREVKHLDEVFAAMEAARPGEKDFIIAGDFNLKPENLEKAVTVAVKTQGTGSTLNSEGERTNNLYDHILVQDEQAAKERIDNPEAIDIRNITTTNKEFYQTISDHLPIILRLRSYGPDDD